MSQDLFSPSLIELTALLVEALGGPSASEGEIDHKLCTLAIRHQVAPLLFAVATNGRHAISAGDLADLRAHYMASVARREAALRMLERVGAQFHAHHINWLALKGTTQAEQLYADPAWRDSADVDLLVAPADFGRALDALSAMDFVASYPPVPVRGLFRHLILAAVRDIMLVAREKPQDSIELHRRLFFAGGRHANFLTLPVVAGQRPIPALGPDLAFYLIAHGALSYWVRLKWLVDLVSLCSKLNETELAAIREFARRSRTEYSAAASLLLLRALFPSVRLGTLGSWLDTMAQSALVQRRFRRYTEMIGQENDQKHSPLNDGWVMLEATFMLFEACSTRVHILVTAPFSSAMRRLAGLIYRDQRSLTLE